MLNEYYYQNAHFAIYSEKNIFTGGMMKAKAATIGKLVKAKLKPSVNEAFALGMLERIEGVQAVGWVNLSGGEKNVQAYLNGVDLGSFEARIERYDVRIYPEFPYGTGFYIHLYPNHIADALGINPDQLLLEVYYNQKRLKQRLEVDSAAYFGVIAEHKYDNTDVNSTLAYLPLMGLGLLKHFNTHQLVAVINHIMVAGIESQCVSVVQEAVFLLEENLQGQLDTLLFSNLKSAFDKHHEFRFVVASSCKAGSKLSRLAIESINQMPSDERYLIKARLSLVHKSLAHTIHLGDTYEAMANQLKDCGSDRELILQLWWSLPPQQQGIHWNQFADTFCFLNDKNGLLAIQVDWSWFVSANQPASFETAVESLLEGAIYQLPQLIRMAAAMGFSSAVVLSALQQMMAHIEKLDWVPVDTVCATLDEYPIERLIDYPERICTILCGLINESFKRNKRLVVHKALMRLSARVISTGMHNNVDTWWLLETSFTHFLLNHEFLQAVDLSGLELCNQEAFLYYSAIISDAESILDFFDKASPENFDLYTVLDSFRKLQLLEKHTSDIAKNFIYQLYHYAKQQLSEEEQAPLILFANYLGAYDKLALPSLSRYEKQMAENEVIQSTSDFYQVNSLAPLLKGVFPARKARQPYFLQIMHHIEHQGATFSDFEERELKLLSLSEFYWIKNQVPIEKKDESFLYSFLASEDPRLYLQGLAVGLGLYIKQHEDAIIFNLQFVAEYVKTLPMVVSAEKIENLYRRLAPLGLPQDRSDVLMQIAQMVLFPYCAVLVYSCQAYQSTRQKVLSETWIKRAREYGVTVRFVMGGVNESWHDDENIYLAVEDTYEALPAKSLAMFDYASKHFSTDYFHKIDDDCLLNVYAHFADPAFFGVDYWGRKLYRGEGAVKRNWHWKKSTSQKAKSSLDLSPEYSTYADGSTGYVLSRFAIEQLLKVSSNSQGKIIIQNSYFEDKLIGDLLGLSDIKVQNRNFSSVVRRNIVGTHESYFWNYNLLPTKNNSLKVMHSEDPSAIKAHWKKAFVLSLDDEQADSHDIISDRPVSELRNLCVTDDRALVHRVTLSKTLASCNHVAILVGKNEIKHWPAMLSHHRNLGIQEFIYIDNVSIDGSLEYMLDQPDVSVFVSTQDYKHSRFSVNWVQAVMANYCVGKWVLILDADEYFVYDDFENTPVKVLINMLEEENTQTLLSPMIDFYPKGSLKTSHLNTDNHLKSSTYYDAIDSTVTRQEYQYGPYGNSAFYSGGMRARVFGDYNSYPTPSYLNHKYCLFKYSPEVELVEGIHFISGRKISSSRAGLLHFKYHASFAEKVEREISAGQHWNGSKEYKRYLSKLESDQKLKVYDKKFSKFYKDSHCLVKSGYLTHL